MPSSSQAPRTSLRTGTASSSTTTATPAAVATSLRMVATPPRVASRSPRTASPVASSRCSTSPFNGAVSLSRSDSMSSSPRASMMVAPWSPIAPETSTASPGRAVAMPSVPGCSSTPTPVVVM
jgi:hypothetical protein